MTSARFTTTLAFVLTIAGVGCTGPAPFPPLPQHRLRLVCTYTTTFCEGGTDTIGTCLDPTPETFDDTDCFSVTDGHATPALGQADCESRELCEQCQAAGLCRRCTMDDPPGCLDSDFCQVRFHSWAGACGPVDPGHHMGGTPTPHECPDSGTADMDAGIPDDADAGVLSDADTGVAEDADAGPPVDAGPPCVEPDAGAPIDGGPSSGVHQILSYGYNHTARMAPLIDATPTRTIDLPADISPPAAISPAGDLWAISDTGLLYAWDLLTDPPTPRVRIDLTTVVDRCTSGAAFPPLTAANGLEVYNAVGDDADVLVAGELGVYLFSIRSGAACVLAVESGMHVDEATFHPNPVSEAARYTVFTASDMNQVFLTHTLERLPPTPSAVQSDTLVGLAIEPVDTGNVWCGLDSVPGQVRDFFGASLGTPPTGRAPSVDLRFSIVTVGGPNEWIEFGADGTEFGGALNDVLVAISSSTTQSSIVAFQTGNLSSTPGELSLSAETTAGEFLLLRDQLFAYVVTAATGGPSPQPPAIRVLYPLIATSGGITDFGPAPLPVTSFGPVRPLDLAVAVPDCGDEPGTCVGFIHVVVELP